MSAALFTTDYKPSPYWWEDRPRPKFLNQDLPKRADVLIIGSGYTGLCAALQTARGGRATVILDAEDAGWGCSSRNGGHVSTGLKPDTLALMARYGKDAGLAIAAEGHNALAWIKAFVADETLVCDFNVSGKFIGAHTTAQFDRLARMASAKTPGLQAHMEIVPRAAQDREIQTDLYHGGLVYHDHASIHPAKYHQALLDKVLTAGAQLLPKCRALAIIPDGKGFIVETARGPIAAADVVVASNGYTDKSSPWLRRRVIPIGSYMIATEVLPTALMDRLLPTQRTIGDTRKVVYYYGPSPDRQRIIFGGRVTHCESDPTKTAPLLHRDLVALFPDLTGYKISHSWQGTVAYTFDQLPHLGRNDKGVYYAAGYCGSGIAMSSYCGTRLGQKILGYPEGKTGFDGLQFASRPYYFGQPWFLSAAVAYYRWQDRLG
jgi:glycine/D-amino acid oxidase-like deaminating enzyme